MTVLPRVRLWGQEGGMLGRQPGGTVGGYRQVCVLMVVTGVEGFTWTMENMNKKDSLNHLFTYCISLCCGRHSLFHGFSYYLNKSI